MQELIDLLPEELAAEVTREILDVNFSTRTHGTRSCRNAGCAGPLCKKAARDAARDNYRAKNALTRRGTNTYPEQVEHILVKLAYLLKDDTHAVAP